MRGSVTRLTKLEPSSVTYCLTSNQKGLRSPHRFTSYREAFSLKFKNCTIDSTLPKGNGRGRGPLLINTFHRLTKSPSSHRHLTPVTYGSTLPKFFPIAI